MDTGPLQKPPSNAHDNDNEVDVNDNVDDDDDFDSCCARNKMSVVKKNKGIRLHIKKIGF